MKSLRTTAAFCLLAGLWALCAGCEKIESPLHPNTPELFGWTNGMKAYSLDDFNSDSTSYEDAVRQNELAQAAILRDRIIHRIRRDIELNYRRYESVLFSGRAGAETAADFAELSLSLAATVTGGEAAKTTLSAISSMVQGTELSISKNFFREKATEVIVSAMRAARDAQLNEILNKMKLSADEYPLDEAVVDLVGFFYAGTLQGALQQIAATEGTKVTEAQEERKVIVGRRVLAHVSKANYDLGRAIRKRIEDIYKAGDIRQAKAALEDLKLYKEEVHKDIKAMRLELLKALDRALMDPADNETRAKGLAELGKALGITPPPATQPAG